MSMLDERHATDAAHANESGDPSGQPVRARPRLRDRFANTRATAVKKMKSRWRGKR